MPSVETVLGPVDVTALGHCQPHEHLFVRRTPASEKNPSLRIDDEDKSLQELLDYRAAGGGMILDAQPAGAGRDAAALSRLSKSSGVHIVGVTGYHRPMFYPPDAFVYEMDEGALLERFLMELQVGVTDDFARLPIRAGAVKAVLGADGLTRRDATLLRAAARAAAQAHVSLVLHTEAGAGAVEAVRLSERMGLDPARVLVCHVDRQAADFRPHEEIAKTSAYLEYDTIHRPKYHDDEAEIRLILYMLDKDFGDRLLLSLDTTAARLHHYGGEIGLDHLITTFLPALVRAGVPAADIHQITHTNPARALAG